MMGGDFGSRAGAVGLGRVVAALLLLGFLAGCGLTAIIYHLIS